MKQRLKRDISTFSPSRLGGFKDSWGGIKPLSAEGYSLQLKKFCQRHRPECDFLSKGFLHCESTCNIVKTQLIQFVERVLPDYIAKNGPDGEGEYPFYELFEHEKEMKATLSD